MLMSRIFTTLNPVFALGFAYFWLSTIGQLDYEPDLYTLKESATGMFLFFMLFAIGTRWHFIDDVELPWISSFTLFIGLWIVGAFSMIMAPVHLLFAGWHGMTPAFMMAGGLWLFMVLIAVVSRVVD